LQFFSILDLTFGQNPPLVHSFSYGGLATDEGNVDKNRFSLEACKLGLQGVTIVVAAGDDGVANFAARNNASACGFTPSFPATCPYVTSVGATQGPESGQPEIACSSATGGQITTGGGFSFFYPMPDYQSGAVSNYLQNGPNLPPQNMFNPNGRGYPDVAVMGYNYNLYDGGQLTQGSGTSASAPVFAAFITLINANRLSGGQTALGFLNPALYQLGASNPDVFNDITVGENNCCAVGDSGTPVCCEYGFNATTGWDAVSGWGSINFPAFSKALESL